MRQKVAIASAYLHDPPVILFDEPHTGLDPLGIRRIRQSILARSGAGAAVVISSHVLSLVEDVCTQLLILDLGHCRFLGRMDEARRAYSDLRSEATLEEIFFRATGPEGGAEAGGEPAPSDARSGRE